MDSRVHLIFASSWVPLDGLTSGEPGRERTVEHRCGLQVHLQRGHWNGLPATWIDWGPSQSAAHLLFSKHRDPNGLAVALAAAIESSPDAAQWLVLLAQEPPSLSADELEQRMKAREGSTIVLWRSPSHELIAAGFSCELYSELIRLDSAHALERLFRRYPCLQLDESRLPNLQSEHSPTVNR